MQIHTYVQCDDCSLRASPVTEEAAKQEAVKHSDRTKHNVHYSVKLENHPD